jgi:hypothetical protein
VNRRKGTGERGPEKGERGKGKGDRRKEKREKNSTLIFWIPKHKEVGVQSFSFDPLYFEYQSTRKFRRKGTGERRKEKRILRLYFGYQSTRKLESKALALVPFSFLLSPAPFLLSPN